MGACLVIVLSCRQMLTDFGYAVADEVRGISVSEFRGHVSRCVKAEVVSAVNRCRRCFNLRPDILLVEEAENVFKTLQDSAVRRILFDVERFFAGPTVRAAQWKVLGGPDIMFSESAKHEASKLSRRYLMDGFMLSLIILSLVCGVLSMFFALFFYSKMFDIDLYETIYKTTALFGFLPALFLAIMTIIRMDNDRVDEHLIRRLMERFVDLASEEFNNELRTSWRENVLLHASSIVDSLNDNGKEILRTISDNFILHNRGDNNADSLIRAKKGGPKEKDELNSSAESSLLAKMFNLETYAKNKSEKEKDDSEWKTRLLGLDKEKRNISYQPLLNQAEREDENVDIVAAVEKGNAETPSYYYENGSVQEGQSFFLSERHSENGDEKK
eukprot:GDKK01059925.1.p1 GENE.GDKK01059925.1~~GDKK01059925.1.p1  ORF type:complete len:386 (-),score=74.17 GDKK01059925.1:89-1246(-)